MCNGVPGKAVNQTNEKGKSIMNINYKVSLAFAQLPDTAIGDYTETTIGALTGNAGFPNLPGPLDKPVILNISNQSASSSPCACNR